MTPEQRAKAVAERFAAELPCQSVPELERIVTSAIKRALGQQLAELEAWAEASAEYAHVGAKAPKDRMWLPFGFMTNAQGGSGDCGMARLCPNSLSLLALLWFLAVLDALA